MRAHARPARSRVVPRRTTRFDSPSGVARRTTVSGFADHEGAVRAVTGPSRYVQRVTWGSASTVPGAAELVAVSAAATTRSARAFAVTRERRPHTDAEDARGGLDELTDATALLLAPESSGSERTLARLREIPSATARPPIAIVAESPGAGRRGST